MDKVVYLRPYLVFDVNVRMSFSDFFESLLHGETTRNAIVIVDIIISEVTDMGQSVINIVENILSDTNPPKSVTAHICSHW